MRYKVISSETYVTCGWIDWTIASFSSAADAIGFARRVRGSVVVDGFESALIYRG